MSKSVEQIRGDVVETIAETTAKGAEKLADGTERVSEAVSDTAGKARSWADDVSGANRRRGLFIVSTVLAAIIVAISWALLKDSSGNND